MDRSPAFPHSVPAGNGHPQIDYPGMTLRDYFAGQVMTAAMSVVIKNATTQEIMEAASKAAYLAADAMLKARGHV